MAPTKLTEYERQRLENIRRNQEMMSALKIRSKATELSASAAKRPSPGSKSYKVPEKKPKTEAPVVIRRSLRTRGRPPADYKEMKVDVDSDVKTSKPSPRDPGPISMEDAYRGTGSDRLLLEAFMGISINNLLSVEIGREIDGGHDFGDENSTGLVKGSDCEGDVGAGESGSKIGGHAKLEGMTLKPHNIARVVPSKIMVVRFFPWADKRMVVTGNKFGNVGFWNADTGGEESGIYLYHPHPGPVSGISIPRCSSTKMFTSCYAGYIRLMDAEKEVFNLLYSTNDNETIYSLSQSPDDVKCLYFGEGQGGLKIWDERIGKCATELVLHDARINTIDFNMGNPNIMSTSSSDGTACIWDLRSVNADKPRTLATVSHERAVHSAYFSPSGDYLATTSLDDKVGILGGTNFEDSSMIYHDNKTSRWISSFRAIWGWDDSYIFVGNLKRGVDVILRDRRKLIWTLTSPEMSAIPCRFDVHPYSVGTLAGATGGGQVYMWTSD